jgi:DNA polymerase-3 subunit epsilon
MRVSWVQFPSGSPYRFGVIGNTQDFDSCILGSNPGGGAIFCMKHIYLDTETSGLDIKRHSIIQLSGLIEIDGEVVEEFDYKIKPFPGSFISKPSLDICGYSMEDLHTFTPPNIVYQEFSVLLAKYIDKYNREDKFHIIGYNSRFDEEFLRDFFVKNRDEYYSSWFWWPSLDVAIMAAILLKDVRHKFQNFKLETLVKHFNIQYEGNAHNALADAKATRNLYKTLSGE